MFHLSAFKTRAGEGGQTLREDKEATVGGEMQAAVLHVFRFARNDGLFRDPPRVHLFRICSGRPAFGPSLAGDGADRILPSILNVRIEPGKVRQNRPDE
ncbi:MAG TPA: hypothetical protein VD767_12430 [Thermomicrobiales bacterium]|nr:hypothetical protein [Thermomicrobiales bacterium]